MDTQITLDLVEPASDHLEYLLDAERAPERGAGGTDVLTFAPVSPWVQRNIDYAQYHQPRGSQYEG